MQGEDAKSLARKRIEDSFNIKTIDSKVVGSFPRKIKTGEYYKDVDTTVLVSSNNYDKLLNKKMFAGKVQDKLLDISITDGERIAVGEQINPRGDIQFIEKNPKYFDIDFPATPKPVEAKAQPDWFKPDKATVDEVSKAPDLATPEQVQEVITLGKDRKL